MKLEFLLIFLFLSLIQAETPPEQRNIQVTASQQKVQFQASYQNGTYQDSFTFDLTLSRSTMQLLSGLFQYQHQDSENQTQIQFNLEVTALLEINTTETDTYKGDPNTIIQHYPNGQGDWNDWVDESKTVDGIRVHSFSATTKDGVFLTRVHIAEESVDVSSVMVGPNDVKIDFEVHNFPRLDNNSRVALQTSIKSQQQSHNSGNQAIDENNLVFGGAGPAFPFGSFSWAPKANASNEEIQVIAYSPQTTTTNQFDLFFTFFTTTQAQAKDIVWDPRVGLDYNAVPGGEFCFASVCGVGAYFIIIGIIVGVITLIALVLFIWFKRRQGYDSIDNPPSYV